MGVTVKSKQARILWPTVYTKCNWQYLSNKGWWKYHLADDRKQVVHYHGQFLVRRGSQENVELISKSSAAGRSLRDPSVCTLSSPVNTVSKTCVMKTVLTTSTTNIKLWPTLSFKITQNTIHLLSWVVRLIKKQTMPAVILTCNTRVLRSNRITGFCSRSVSTISSHHHY